MMTPIRYLTFQLSLLGLLMSAGNAQQAGNLEARFEQLDRNKDGKIDRTELLRSEFFERFGRNSDGYVTKQDLGFDKKKSDEDSAPMPGRGDNPSELGESSISFAPDYVAGTYDANGEFMGGTETMRMTAHEGLLFAGIGYWTDQPGDDPRPGAQILVKRGKNEAWEVCQSFPGAVRISSMETVTFRTDHLGERLKSPVTLLVADAGLVAARRSGPLFVHVYNAESNEWIASQVGDDISRAYIRAFGAHRDSETGIDHIFVGYVGAFRSNGGVSYMRKGRGGKFMFAPTLLTIARSRLQIPPSARSRYGGE